MTETDKSRLIDLDEVVATKFKGKKIPGFVMRFLKSYVHQDFLNSIIKKNGDGIDFCTGLIQELNITLDVKGLENVPADGTLYTFASNHPLGGVDGFSLASIIGKKFGRVRIPVNDFLMYIKPIAPCCVPVNKMGSQSRDLPRLLDEIFKSGDQMLIFPAGLCSRKIDGKIEDLPWTKTFINKSIESRRAIVPVHFIGQNSNRFYRVANLCKKLKLKLNLAMLMLPDEMFRARGSSYTIVFGKPIPVESFDSSRTRLEWAAEVRKQVYEL